MQSPQINACSVIALSSKRLEKELVQRSVAIALAMRSSAIANYCDYAIEPLVSDRVASCATHTDFSNTL